MATLAHFGTHEAELQTEADPNAVFHIFSHLDKALASAKVGDQCEAIIEVQKHLEVFKFPLVVNAAFLKLADVFRKGSNLLRLCILRITLQSKKHLTKITNVEEFLRRIFSVTHSNDPIARAITIRVLGSAVQILSERKNVHHCILNGLESNDPVEVQAAVWATSQATAQSRSFAVSALDQLSELISDLSTPVDHKLKLLPIFQHMHYSPTMTSKVRDLCTRLLEECPSRAFVLVTLHTLSELSSKALTDIPQQILLLEKYLVEEHRQCVKALCLRDMALLAKRAPHVWNTTDIQCLCEFVLDRCPEERLQISALRVLASLSASIAIGQFNPTQDPDHVAMRCCQFACFHMSPSIAALGSAILVQMAIHQQTVHPESRDLAEQASIALETLLSILLSSEDSSRDAVLKQMLITVVTFCTQCPSMADPFIDAISTAIPAAPTQGACRVLLSECLMAICSRHNDLLPGLMPDLLRLLRDSCHDDHNNSARFKLSVMTLLFQACCSSDDELDDLVTDEVMKCLNSMDCWSVYRIGRQAARYSHHQMAARIFSSLISKISLEHYYYWINSLRECCEGESTLKSTTSLPDFVANITKAENHYHQSIAAMKAASTLECTHAFQIRFLRLRAKVLQAFVQVVRASCSFRTSPPPAIATSLAVTTGQDVHKCGHVISQLKRCAMGFKNLMKDYQQLHQSAFDADDSSLINVKVQEQTCCLMAKVLHLLTDFQDGNTSSQRNEVSLELLFRNSGGLFTPEAVPTEHQKWVSACNQVLSLLQQSSSTEGDVSSLTYQRVQCIEQSAMVLCNAQLSLPRFFFQQLRQTQIRLAIEPSQEGPKPLTIHYDTHLSLSCEGIITQKGQQMPRTIQEVKMTVSTQLKSKGQVISDKKYADPSSAPIVRTAKPLNDYFRCEALLYFPVPGLYQITVDTALVDPSGVEWGTGPQATLNVSSYDEAVHRQQQQMYAQRQHQRAFSAASSN